MTQRKARIIAELNELEKNQDARWKKQCQLLQISGTSCFLAQSKRSFVEQKHKRLLDEKCAELMSAESRLAELESKDGHLKQSLQDEQEKNRLLISKLADAHEQLDSHNDHVADLESRVEMQHAELESALSRV